MMKTFLQTLLLALSLLFNLFFAGGYLQARRQLEQTAVPAETSTVSDVREALQLDPTQEALFASLHERIQSVREEARTAMMAARTEVSALLDDPSSSPAQIDEAMERMLNIRRSVREDEMTTLREFLDVLSTEQQNAMMQKLIFRDARGERDDRRESRFHRFDRDGDGELSAEERALMRDELRRHHDDFRDRVERHRDMRRRLHERFDANGDGVLDDAEREALTEWRRSQDDQRRGE